MKSFAAAKVGNWPSHHVPYFDSKLFIVAFVGRYIAYCIKRYDEDEFLDWLSAAAERKGYVRLKDAEGDLNESADEHLSRIGCEVVSFEIAF